MLLGSLRAAGADRADGLAGARAGDAAAPPPVSNGGLGRDRDVAARRDVPVYLEGLGTVQAFYTATITARVDGELQRVDFVEGQMVKKGELLAQIDPRPFQAALDQALGTQAKDAAQLESAQRIAGPLPDARRRRISPASRRSIRSARWSAQLQAQIKVDQAAIDNARTQLAYTSITAPIAGRTGIRLVDPGNNVHATDTTGIVVVTQMQPISVVFTLPEDELPQVSGRSAPVRCGVTALSRDDKTQLDTGTLTLVDNQIDPDHRHHAAEGDLSQRAATRSGRASSSTCACWCSSRQDVLTMPRAAVQRGPDGLFAYVVKADSTVEARPAQDRRGQRGRHGRHRRPQRRRAGGHSAISTGCSPARACALQAAATVRRSHSVRRHEHLRAVRPAADRDLAADGRHPADRHRRLSAAAGGAAAAGGLSDHRGDRQSAGRQPGDHGLLGGDAAGVPVRRRSRVCRR